MAASQLLPNQAHPGEQLHIYISTKPYIHRETQDPQDQRTETQQTPDNLHPRNKTRSASNHGNDHTTTTDQPKRKKTRHLETQSNRNLAEQCAW